MEARTVPRVVVDTNVLMSAHRHWIYAATLTELLDGYWSAYIVAEFARIKFRSSVERCARHRVLDECLYNAEYKRRIQETVVAFSEVLTTITDFWSYSVNPGLVADPWDEDVLMTALAGRVEFIVSLDKETFKHGTTYFDTSPYQITCVTPDWLFNQLVQLNPDTDVESFKQPVLIP